MKSISNLKKMKVLRWNVNNILKNLPKNIKISSKISVLNINVAGEKKVVSQKGINFFLRNLRRFYQFPKSGR